MPDYNLAGLSPRSFEQLIQALAAKIIGPNIVVFGDGRDGGREATFDGPIPFPSREHGWRGYGVVQAKFKQKPEDPAKDGAWALQQLESDLKKFVDPDRKLRKPQYYIFATNVVLTAVADSGSKDKAAALFEKYAAELGVQDYDIWDADKISRFLDDHQEIRRAYAAWITSGDVLAEVMGWFQSRRPDFERVIRRFLQEELRRDQFARLGQAGSTGEDQIPLARVFIDLPVAAERKNEPPAEEVKDGRLPTGFVAMAREAAAQRLDAETLHAWRQARPAAEREAQPPGRFVVIGGPGQGKSTVGQFICQLFRAALLKDMPPHLISVDARDALTQISAQCDREGIELPTARRFPLRVVLNDFAAHLDAHHPAHVDSLLAFVVAQIRKQSRSELSIDDFRDWLGAYPWLLVLDGLDEVPASSNRAEVLEAIKAFWTDVADCNADLLVIATTRPQGYNDDFSPKQYQHHWLLPLSKARALYYAGRLAELRHPRDIDRQEKIVRQLQRAAANDATARLMGSPLQVTIMAVLVEQMGQPPQDRWGLFNAYYDVIYRRELEREIKAAEILREHKTDIEVIHRRVGLLLQLASERAGGTDAKLSAQHFAEVVDTRLREEGYSGDPLAKLSRQIIEAATERLVFLVGLEVDQVGFEIRSLQEFMAAEALMDGEEDQIRRRLREIAPIVSWRNVFLFAAGKCFAQREHLRETIYTICGDLNDNPVDHVASTTLAGSQLALDLLEDGPARSRPNVARMFTRVALRLLALPHDTYHLRLADVYDQSLEEVYRAELELRLGSGSARQSSGAWACLFVLAERGLDWAKQIAHHFRSGSEQKYTELLLWLVKQRRSGRWTVEQLIEVIPQVSPFHLQSLDEIVYGADDIRGMLPRWFWAVAGLMHALNVLRDPEYDVPLMLSGLDEDAMNFELGSLINRRASSMEYLYSMPDPNPLWKPLIAQARFIEAPSRKTLAVALRVVAQHWTDESVDWIIRTAPWPLSACIAACSDEQQLIALAERAAHGELGDLDDWYAAEARWDEQGIVAADIEHLIDERWPFDQMIAERGFPFAYYQSFSSRMGNDLFDHFRTLYQRLPPGAMRDEIASWIVWFVKLMGSFARPDSTNTRELWGAEYIRDIIQNTELPDDFINGLNGLASVAFLDESWVEFLDSIGRRLPLTNASQTDPLSVFLSKMLPRHSDYPGLLRLLASTVLGGEQPNLSAVLVDPARYDEPMFRDAAIIVRVGLGFKQQNEATQLATYVAELAIMNSKNAEQLLRATRTRRAAMPLNDYFLLELLRLVPPDKSRLVQQIVAELNDVLRQRTSRLHEREVWERLGLPQGLNTI